MEDERANLKKLYSVRFAAIRAATFLPLGAALMYTEIPKYFDEVQGNESLLFSALGLYMVVRGFTSAISYTKHLNQSGLEDKVE